MVGVLTLAHIKLIKCCKTHSCGLSERISVFYLVKLILASSDTGNDSF